MSARRCPMCHQVNEQLDWQCRRCNYEFGQPIEKVRILLRDQMTNARIAFWSLVACTLALFAIPGYLLYSGSAIILVPGMLPVLLVTRWTIRAWQRIRI